MKSIIEGFRVQINHRNAMIKYTWKNDYHFEGGSFWRGMWYFQNMCVRSNGDYMVFTLKNHTTLKVKFNDLLNKFLDILNPTQNELVLFELEYGFEFPFCEKNKKINIKENKYE